MNQPLSLEEPFHETDRAKLYRWLPWLHLLRTFRLAIRWQNLTLMALALFAMAFVSHTLSRFVLTSDPYTRPYSHSVPWEVEPEQNTWSQDSLLDTSLLGFSTDRGTTLLVRSYLAPVQDLARAFVPLFDSKSSWSEVVWAWTLSLLQLATWSLFAGALTRRVLLEFTGQGAIGVIASLRYAWREFPSTFGAPTIAMVGVGILCALGRTIGFIGMVPGAGELIATLLWGVQFLFALMITVILFGLAGCWPLMIASQSAEGTDGFDSLNRGFNYLFVRPWYTLWMVNFSVLYGGACLWFFSLVVRGAFHLTNWLNAPFGDELLKRWSRVSPPLFRERDFIKDLLRDSGGEVATTIVTIWQYVIGALVTAFPFSFFWASVAIIYLLLRKSVDAYPLDRVHVPQPAEARESIPLVGVAASRQREQSNPAPSDPAPDSSEPETTPPAE